MPTAPAFASIGNATNLVEDLMDEETRETLARVVNAVEAAVMSAAKARAENAVIAALLGHLAGHWAATTRGGGMVLAQVAEMTRKNVQDAVDLNPDGELEQAAVKMATLLQNHMDAGYEGKHPARAAD